MSGHDDAVHLARPKIDLRTDTLTAPTDSMWQAMKAASLALTENFSGDARIRALEQSCADLAGHESAVFAPTTSLANLVAMLALCEPGDQVIMGSKSHLFWWEQRNVSAHARAATRLIRENRFGELPLDELTDALEGGDYGIRIRTAAIALENTHNFCGGTCLSPAYTRAVADLASEYRTPVFVDGARLFNAAVAQGVELSQLTSHLDAVSLSLNKGLGAPYGAILCGSAEIVRSARRHLASLGAHSVHRAGIFAAAALVALDEHATSPHLPRDHIVARRLADQLVELPGVSIDMETVQTNIVVVCVGEHVASDLVSRLSGLGIGVSIRGPDSIRLVTHRDFHDTDVAFVYGALQTLLAP